MISFFANFVPVEGKELLCPETSENLDADSWQDGNWRIQQESRHLFRSQDEKVGTRERWFLDVRRRVFGGPTPRDAKLKKNVRIPHIVEPRFGAIGLCVERVFEMMAVNLVHVALWKTAATFFKLQPIWRT